MGGEDFDDCLVKHFEEDLQKNYQKVLNDRSRRRLRTACETVKVELSSLHETSLMIDGFLGEDVDYTAKITRTKFEKLCEALANAKIEKTNIDKIVVVGGSTRIPKVQDTLRAFFDGKELSKSIDADEAGKIEFTYRLLL